MPWLPQALSMVSTWPKLLEPLSNGVMMLSRSFEDVLRQDKQFYTCPKVLGAPRTRRLKRTKNGNLTLKLNFATVFDTIAV